VKFGLFMLLPGGYGRTPAQVYRNNLELIRVAEDLGFYSAYVAEHHFSEYGLVNDPMVFLAAAAVQTSRIRLGAGVMIVPLYSPLRLAENAAMVDVLSGGRLDFGIGRGYQPHEFHAFNVPMEESQARTDEAMEFLRRAWTEDDVTFEGKFHTYRNVSLSPKPIQQPHPPILTAAVSPSTFKRMGELGEPILTSPNFTPLELIKENFSAYRAALRARGANLADYDYPLMQQCYVAEDEQRGYDEPQEAAMQYYNLLGRLLPKDVPGEDGTAPSYEFYGKIQRNVTNLQYDFLYEHGVTFGDPGRVVERIQRLQEEAGINYYQGWFNFGSLDHELALASLKRFGEKVMPKFEVETAAVPASH
jgi:alkanesulfonate monooxygenase SsuD/methylene tetrahydromethanopterin reductase-like flavin-dependent oxidoreductase (luciferase family)